MESFVHLRKGTTPRRLHADLDGLKDDELGRGGFTGRTANMYRRNDPTAYRSRRAAAAHRRAVQRAEAQRRHRRARARRMLLFSNADCQVLLSRRTEQMPFFVRYVDGDLLCFVHKGAGLLETEFGPLRYREGDWIYLPKACTWRQVPDEETTLLMIEATDEFRVPPAGHSAALPVRPVAGRHPRAVADRRRRPRRVRGAADPSKVARHRFSTNTIRSTSRAGAATTSRSPSTSPTTTSSPPTASTCRRRCTCSCRPPAST